MIKIRKRDSLKSRGLKEIKLTKIDLSPLDLGKFVRFVNSAGVSKYGILLNYDNSTRIAKVVFDCKGYWSEYKQYPYDEVFYNQLSIIKKISND